MSGLSRLQVPFSAYTVSAAMFECRLDRSTATVLTLNPTFGLVMEIGRETITLDVANVLNAYQVTNAANLIDNTGADIAATPPSASTQYYVYASNGSASNRPYQLALSTAVPGQDANSQWYLNTAGNGANWRFVGTVFTSAGTQFVDTVLNRDVFSQFNRIRKTLFVNPGYTDDNSTTTVSVTQASWALYKAADGQITFFDDGLNCWDLIETGFVNLIGANGAWLGIGIDSTTGAAVAAQFAAAVSKVEATMRWSGQGTVGQWNRHTASMLAISNTAASTFVADFIRMGSATDPVGTNLRGTVLC